MFKEAVIVFLSLMEKAKGDTQDQVQQFKPHTNALSKGSIAPVLQKSFRKKPGGTAAAAVRWSCG
jgi:hypothetical protein